MCIIWSPFWTSKMELPKGFESEKGSKMGTI